MAKYLFCVLLLSIVSLVISEIIYPGPGLVEGPWYDPRALSHKHCWKNNIVPYMILNNEGITDIEGHVGAIQKAIDKFNAVTCLHYVHVEEAPVDSREFLVFNRTQEGWCRMHELRNISSGVRYVVLTLQVTCLKRRLEHMMMHALGFLHEHQRSDRDCYVEVESTQVGEVNYKIVPQPRWEERYPYDKYSVLHYHNNHRLKSLIVIEDPDEAGSVQLRRKALPIEKKSDYRQPVGSDQLSKLDISKIKYKFCKGPHFCDIPSSAILCERANEFKKMKNCTTWRVTSTSPY